MSLHSVVHLIYGLLVIAVLMIVVVLEDIHQHKEKMEQYRIKEKELDQYKSQEIRRR